MRNCNCIFLSKLMVFCILLNLFCSFELQISAENNNFSVDIYYENSTVKAYVNFYEVGAKGVLIGALLNDGINISTVTAKAEKNMVLKFNEGAVGNCIKIFLWDSLNGMKPLCEKHLTNIKVEDGFMLSTKLNMIQPGNVGGYAGQFEVEDNFVYLCRQGTIYKIDVTDAKAPVMLERIVYERGKSHETQGGEVFEHNGKVYYAVAGFGDGIRMYDITDFCMYVENPVGFDKVPEITSDDLLWFYHFYSHGIGGNHTYDLTVKYPYVYATIATQRSQKDNPDRVQGVITLDITDVEKAPKTHTLSMIANADKNNMVTGSDTEPSIIYRLNDWLIVNNDTNGIAYFDIGENASCPKYRGTFNFLKEAVYSELRQIKTEDCF